ncbi:MAG: alpha/beta hydrolase [Pseudomonadota bacterium]
MPRFTTSDGLSLHFEDDGQGTPVLCLAGLTRNSDDFNYLLPHLKGYRVIRMDYRGRGQSDYTDDFMSYNILREGQDAVELLDHLGLAKTALIGTSRGGLIAMALSVTAPERLSGVVLNDIGPEVAPEGIARIFDYVGKIPPFADLDEAAEAVASGHADGFPDVPFERWREQTEFMWDNASGGGIALRYDARLRDAMIGQAGTGDAPDLWQLFDGLKTLPLAAIRGANSDLLATETFEKMQERHPEMISATVPNRGHVPFLDEPEALAAIHALLEQTK